MGVKGKEYWAKQHALNWSDPPPPTEAQDALAHAYAMGFEKMRMHAIGLLSDLGPNGKQLSILIGAIGTAEVDPDTGEALHD